MNNNDDNEMIIMFTIENIKDLFHCFNGNNDVHVDDVDDDDESLLNKCCHFLNNSSADLKSDKKTTVINVSGKRNVSKKRLRSKNDSSNQTLMIDDHNNNNKIVNEELNKTLSSLSNNIKQIQLELNQDQSIDCETINSFFSKSNLITCDLVKLRKYLISKCNNYNNKEDSKKRQNHNHQSSSFSYNSHIDHIINNRFLFLQLLHFECIIDHYLVLIVQTFCNRSLLSKEIILSQLQCLFRSYYSLIIQLSYEPQFAQCIRSYHPRSSTITSKILYEYLQSITNNDTYDIDDSIINNRSIVIIVDYVIILNRLGLICFKKEIFKNVMDKYDSNNENGYDFCHNIEKINDYSIKCQEDWTSQINLVKSGDLVLTKFYSVEKFIEKSILRSRTIIMLFDVCRKLQYDSDRLVSASILTPTLLKLLERINIYHMEICERNTLLNLNKQDIITLERGEKLMEKNSQQKSYVSVLREVYGIISLLLTFTESLITNKYLRSMNIATILFEKFFHPFILSLNGTEDDDPVIVENQCIDIDSISEAYRISILYRKQFDRVQHYLNRLVYMSSMAIQRLSPSLLLPIANSIHNPFRFQYAPAEIARQISDDQDHEIEDLLIMPFISDEEYLESDLFSESELEDSSTGEKKQTENDSLVESYLHYFPEIKLKQMNNSSENESLKLSCSCDNPEHSESIKFDEKNFCSIINESKIENFDWKANFIQIYDSIKTVIPKKVVPAPELNFLFWMKNTDTIHPMTYPFLRKAIRMKNFHHIKLCDHIRQRLINDGNSNYKIVYDIENEIESDQNCLMFESRFECGNLRKAFYNSNGDKSEEEEYILILNTDINSASHTQWFYFCVKQMKPAIKYRFKIINCEKKSILFNDGQQPLFYSCKEFEKTKNGWRRIHDDQPMIDNKFIVAYYRNHYVKDDNYKTLIKGKSYYTLEFTLEFPYADDECYFAFNVPFSYSQLKTCIKYWSQLIDDYNNNRCSSMNDKILFTSQTLCSTLKGNDLPVITITSNNEYIGKHYIMITARVHPSESNSSWIMKGIIDFLLSNSPESKLLLNKYIFKIIPMLNPDGVINGCTRTDLQTEDLNRHWHDPSSILHPTIYHSKMLLECLHKYSGGRNPIAFFDIHGHSRRHNIFSYSCFPMLSWKKSDYQNYSKKHILNHMCVCTNSTQCTMNDQLRSIKNNDHIQLAVPPFFLIPLILKYQKSPAFDIDYCVFAIQRDREQTARVVAWRQFGIPLTYTIECSASGCNKGPYAGQNLSIKQMQEMGYFLVKSFKYIQFIYCSQQHFPIFQIPIDSKQTNTKNNDDDDDENMRNMSVSKMLLNRCARSRSSDRSDTEKQQKIKQMIINLYPDVIDMDFHFH